MVFAKKITLLVFKNIEILRPKVTKSKFDFESFVNLAPGNIFSQGIVICIFYIRWNTLSVVFWLSNFFQVKICKPQKPTKIFCCNKVECLCRRKKLINALA
jgi:hypothetical protein